MAKHLTDNQKSDGSTPSPSTNSLYDPFHPKMGPLQFYVTVMNLIPSDMRHYASRIYDEVVDAASSVPCSNDEAEMSAQEIIDRIKILMILDK